jgi:DNA-damage-inducible protein J
MAQTSLVQVRVDSELKHQAEALFADIGLDISTAVKLFFKLAVSRQELPFPLARKTADAGGLPPGMLHPLHIKNPQKYTRDELHER